MNPTVPAPKPLARPHNCYNVFFILEREKVIRESRQRSAAAANASSPAPSLCERETSTYDLSGYYFLELPELPPRYQGLELAPDWYVPGRNANRKHVKNAETHGLTSFADLARTVATNWKAADAATKGYCRAVARILKDRHSVLKQDRYMPLPPLSSNSQTSVDRSKKQSTSRKWKGAQMGVMQNMMQQRQNQMHQMQLLRKRQSMPNLAMSDALAFNPWDLLVRPSSAGIDLPSSVGLPYGDIASARLCLDSACSPVTPENGRWVVRANDAPARPELTYASASLPDVLPSNSTFGNSNAAAGQVDMSDAEIRSMFTSDCF